MHARAHVYMCYYVFLGTHANSDLLLLLLFFIFFVYAKDRSITPSRNVSPRTFFFTDYVPWRNTSRMRWRSQCTEFIVPGVYGMKPRPDFFFFFFQCMGRESVFDKHRTNYLKGLSNNPLRVWLGEGVDKGHPTTAKPSWQWKKTQLVTL